MEYFDCTRECKYCVAKLCEKRSNYIKGEATNTLGEEYDVLNSNFACSGISGLGCFCPSIGVGYTDANFGLLGCVSEEIAVYFGKHFGMLITEAKYGDTIDFEIISDHYQKRSCISTK